MMLLAVLTALVVALGLTVHLMRPRGHTAVAPDGRNGGEAVRRLALMTAAASAIVAAVWFAWFLQHSRFMEIDRCLDAGGVWDYEWEVCRIE